MVDSPINMYMPMLPTTPKARKTGIPHNKIQIAIKHIPTISFIYRVDMSPRMNPAIKIVMKKKGLFHLSLKKFLISNK